MTDPLLLERVLSLPANDIKALKEGRTIAALPISQIQKGWNFILFPYSEDASSHNINLEIWATCEDFKMIHEAEQLLTLSALTLWSLSELERLFEERSHLSLALLRVYQLSEPVIIPKTSSSSIKLGKFIGLSNFDGVSKELVQITEVQPILSSTVFSNRYRQITRFQPPKHPRLEALQIEVTNYAQAYPDAKNLDDDLRCFLGWADKKNKVDTNKEYGWIQEIASSGNSSDGDLFEKLVRKSLVELGFSNTLEDPKLSLNPEKSGGAGGIDFYCEAPYAMIGECKASKLLKVNDNKDGAPAQLIKHGHTYLGKKGFDNAIKIIMAPGNLTKYANQTAIGNQMNVMRPETLQRLVELNIAHPGAIDLLELKPYLESAPFGTDADKKVDEFIDRMWQRIKVRSKIVESVKALQENGDESVSASNVRIQFNALFAPLHGKLDSSEQAHDLLVELSSPLTGYLGRKKCETWSGDRFYFLRDLIV